MLLSSAYLDLQQVTCLFQVLWQPFALATGGVAEPSDNDDKITEQIRNALQTVNINLQDHLVIAGDEYFNYRQTGYLE
jgi:DNA repair proteins